MKSMEEILVAANKESIQINEKLSKLHSEIFSRQQEIKKLEGRLRDIRETSTILTKIIKEETGKPVFA